MTAPRFLVDENLSVKLPEAAHRRGFEATHVIHLGLHEWKDWNILEVVGKGGWILVTNNAVEFRSRYRAIEIHPGVVFLLPSVRRQQQLLLFESALDDLAINPDLVNQALDIAFSKGGGIVVRRYALPYYCGDGIAVTVHLIAAGRAALSGLPRPRRQAAQFMLADSVTEHAMTQLLVYQTAVRADAGTLVSRIRSSLDSAARSVANFGFEGHQPVIESRVVWFRSSLDGLAARMKRTSEPPHARGTRAS